MWIRIRIRLDPHSIASLDPDPDPEVPKFTEMVKRKERRETVLSFKVAQK